jgi:hypothetical protein
MMLALLIQCNDKVVDVDYQSKDERLAPWMWEIETLILDCCTLVHCHSPQFVPRCCILHRLIWRMGVPIYGGGHFERTTYVV